MNVARLTQTLREQRYPNDSQNWWIDWKFEIDRENNVI